MTTRRQRRHTTTLARNHACFLLGASWGHDPAWSPRLIHMYLGPWLVTLAIPKDEK
jgi:hypothetical protein